MGSASSKAAKAAAGAASRQYPTRVPHNPPPSTNASAASALPSTHTSHIASPAAQAAQSSPPPAAANGAPTDPPPSSSPHAVSTSRNAAIDHDASDPHFAASLRQLGPVTPSSTMSNSSTFTFPSATSSSTFNSAAPTANQQQQHPSGNIFPNPSQNPALLILQARERIAEEAEREFAAARTGGNGGRRFLDVGAIREALMLRDVKGLSGEEIEERLRLKKGVMGLLARVGEARVGRVDGGDSGLY